MVLGQSAVEREKQIIKRYRQGVGSPAIARELGLKTSTVEALIGRRGILRPLGSYRGVPRPSRRKFSESEEQEIVRLYKSGFGTSEIGSRLGYAGSSRSSTVNRLLARRGVPRRTVVEAQGGCPDRLAERATVLYGSGRSCGEIAIEFGGKYSADAVRNLLRRHGVSFRHGGDANRGRHKTGIFSLSAAQQRAAIRRYRNGKSATEIAVGLRVSFGTIYEVLKAHGVPLHKRLDVERPEDFARIVDLYTRRALTLPQLAARFDTTPMMIRGAFRRRHVLLYGNSEAQRIRSRQGFRPRFVSPPKRNTRIEVALQNVLRELGVPFSASAFVNHSALENGGKEFDLALPHYVLIEVDGDWKNNPRHPASAAAQLVMKREAVAFSTMEKDGYKVLRFWGRDINKRPMWVTGQIIEELTRRGWKAPNLVGGSVTLRDP